MTHIVFGGSASSGGGAAEVTPYRIPQSLRFKSHLLNPNTAYPLLTRTQSTSGDQYKCTFSAWIKKTTGVFNSAGQVMNLFASYASSVADYGNAWFNFQIVLTSNILEIKNTSNLLSPQHTFSDRTGFIFNDSNAWVHLVVSIDTTLELANDRVKVYLNGNLMPKASSTTPPNQNTILGIGQPGSSVWVGSNPVAGGNDDYFEGYMADVRFVDGVAASIDSFGSLDTAQGLWTPKAYNGAYGTNGFWLKFEPGTIGADHGGGQNNFSASNNAFDYYAAFHPDVILDSPTSYTGGDGDVRGNYALLCRQDQSATPTAAPVGRCGTTVTGTSTATNATGNTPVWSGKWYWEAWWVGGTFGRAGMRYADTGSNTSTYTMPTANKWYGFSMDFDTGIFSTTPDGVTWSNVQTGLTAGTLFIPLFQASSGTTLTVNFGQEPFRYAVPSGHKAICSTNMPASINPRTAVDVLLYTGRRVVRFVETSCTFAPDGNIYTIGSNAAEGNPKNGIRKVTPQGVVTTLVDLSDRIVGSAKSIVSDQSGNLYFYDWNYRAIYKYVAADQAVILLAGTEYSDGWDDGPIGVGKLPPSAGLLGVDGNGNLYVGETYRIRKVSPEGVITTLVGNDPENPGDPYYHYWDSEVTPPEYSVSEKYGAIDSNGNVFFSEYKLNNELGGYWDDSRILKISTSGQISIFYQSEFFVRVNGVDLQGNVYFTESHYDASNYISSFYFCKVSPSGVFEWRRSQWWGFSTYSPPEPLKFDAAGNIYAILDGILWKITQNGNTVKIAGAGGTVGGPTDLAINGSFDGFLGPLLFSPDLIWTKPYSATGSHIVSFGIPNSDAGRYLQLNSIADAVYGSNLSYLKGNFIRTESDGYVIGNDAAVNTVDTKYVSYVFDSGPSKGFERVAYSGTGVARNLTHGLGVKPALILVKAHYTPGTDQGWIVWHKRFTGTQYTTIIGAAAAPVTSSAFFSAAPDASKFYIGTNAAVNALNNDYVAYLFSEIPGVTSAGSYAGNGSATKPIIVTGFRPALVMTVATTRSVFDGKRRTGLNDGYALAPGTNAAEGATDLTDFLSNGFIAPYNTASTTYYYFAWAEKPFGLGQIGGF